MSPDLAAWDGRGTPSDNDTAMEEQSAPDQTRSKAAVKSKPIKPARGYAKDSTEPEWARREAADLEADAKLSKQLIICTGCGPSGRDDGATGRARKDRAAAVPPLNIHDEVPANGE